MTWNTDDAPTNMLPKADAIKRIVERAEEDGIKGDFKVYYDGALIADPNNLPDSVDIDKVSVSTVNKNG